MADYIPTNGSSVIATRWLTEEVFKLIELVQRDEAIYNPRHKYYFCRPYVENFWREVDQKLDKNPGASLAKWTNLRISFRREFTNYLEEQVPPCWTYFDRMFFLHPYLRKKQQQTQKPGDTSLQENNLFVQISEISQRWERRSVKDLNKPVATLDHTQNIPKEQPSVSNASNDHYFDYYDEPDHNNSELDDITDEEQHKIKSECEDEIQEDEYDQTIESHSGIDTDPDTVDEITVASSSKQFPLNARVNNKRAHQQLRLEHLNRIQTRSYQEDLRAAKRPRSQERAPSNSQNLSLSNNGSTSQRSHCSGATAHPSSSSNVSFVRPTFTKSLEANNSSTNIVSNDIDGSAISLQVPVQQHQQSRHNLHPNHHSQRLENINSLSSALNSSNNISNSNNSQPSRQLVSPTATPSQQQPHLELCDCKTDPDAMFLMSLLPDIQKLNGRDRGKIKIAFQNILQDYLYPD